MNIELEILKTDNGNPNNAEYYGYFYEVKEGMERSLVKYAKHGILPSVDDVIVGTHADESMTEYKVFSKTFYDDRLLIFVEWF